MKYLSYLNHYLDHLDAEDDPMTTTHEVIAPADLVSETRRNHQSTLDALRRVSIRNAQRWRRISDYNVPVPGLEWTAAETAAHMIGDLRDYTEVLTRYAKGYVTHPQQPAESPSRMSAAVNARHLVAVPDRNLHRLAAQLEQAAADYVAVAETIGTGTSVLTPNGLVIDPSTMTGLLLGEQLIHGLDIARAAERDWTIGADEALLAIPAVLAVAPDYLRPSQANQRVSFELRMRGGARYRFAVVNGTALVSEAGAPVDCTITADPVAFLLVGFGRVPQWSAVLRGKLRVGGRRPWRAAKFGALLSNP